jgi:tetratricopeptide (TPR) repeat protein
VLHDQTETVPPLSPLPAHRGRLAPGVLLGDRYEVRGELGQGGHTVYRVFDREVKREVALKLLDAERETPNALSRLRREVRVARDAVSPRLVRIFDLGTCVEGTFLTMEVVDGPSLRELLQKGPLDVREAVRIGAELFEGLAALHRLQIVHRDVKPGNVLLAGGSDVKLADFGLARRLDLEETKVTRTEGIVGTLAYLSPEQAVGKEAKPESDLYSAGLVLFEMLAGRLPHEVASEFGRRLSSLGRAPDIRKFRPETPRWLARVVGRLLEVRPGDRYRTAEEVLGDLAKEKSPPRLRLRRRLLRTSVLALLCLPPLGVVLVPSPGAKFSHLVPLGETGIAAVGTHGERLWTLPGVAPDIADRGTLARITPDGPRLIALVLAKPGRWMPEDISTLTFLDPDSGKVVREVKLPSGAGHFPNDPPRFAFASAKAVDLFHDGMDEVIVSFSHVPEAPFYAVLYAPRYDQARVVYFSRGGQDFQGAADLDGDGVPELLFAGINNGWNWVNVVASVKLDPRYLKQADWLTTAAAPDAMGQPQEDRMLLWYATVPRGHLEGLNRLTIDEKRHQLVVNYLSGGTFTLGFDGFPPGKGGRERQEARRAAYRHLWEAERLRKGKMFGLAMPEAEAALTSANEARETWLAQYAERLRAKILVAEGRTEEAEALFMSVAEKAEDAPEVAYDAGVAFHLAGDLPRAVFWYERGFGRASAIGAGKSKHEFLKGEILALVEEKKYEEALAAVERFGATYPSFQASHWLYHEYIRWRSGEEPQVDPGGVQPNWTDLERYWAMEFEFAGGVNPREMLPRVDRFLAERPETRAEALSLRAELLVRLGRPKDAREAAGAALELVEDEAGRSIIGRAHRDLVEERARRLRARLLR